MSSGRSVQFESLKVFLYWGRWVRPGMALHVSEVPLVVTLNSPTFRSIATTVKVLESLLFGEPLSVTTTVMELVVVPGGPEGVQAKTPLVGLIVAPGGALVPRVKVNCWTGM